LKVLVKGRVRGTVLKSETPINFLGAVDKDSGIVSDPNHELHGRGLKGAILVFPYGSGSSVGAYTIYSLKDNGVAPLAMICQKADNTVASGCAMANIPCVAMGADFVSLLRTGQELELDTEAGPPTITITTPVSE